MNILATGCIGILLLVGPAAAVGETYEVMQASGATNSSNELARLFKHEYCVVCSDGKKLNCDAPMGGEAGRAWCAADMLQKCLSQGHVDYNHCSK